MRRVGDKRAERVGLALELVGVGRLPGLAGESQPPEGELGNVQRPLRRLPSHRILGQELHVVRDDLAAPERAHQRFAEPPLVARSMSPSAVIMRAQILAELDVRRRAVVDGANADVEELRRDVARLLRDAP